MEVGRVGREHNDGTWRVRGQLIGIKLIPQADVNLRRSLKGCVKSHPRRRRAVPQLRFGQDDVWFELRRVRCGLPTNRPELGEGGGTAR